MKKETDPLKQTDTPRSSLIRPPIPWDHFDRWHLHGLIEEQHDIMRDKHLYAQLLANPNTTEENRRLVKELIELDEARFWRLDLEIERLSCEQAKTT